MHRVFQFPGNLEACITIRTIVVKGKKAYVQAGAGCVADSVLEKEYQETVNKSKSAAQGHRTGGAKIKIEHQTGE